MNSSKKLPMTLKSGWLRVYRDGHRLTSKAIALLVSFSKQMSVSEIQFHQISYRAQGKMWVEGKGSAASQTTSGIGWGVVPGQRTAREEKNHPEESHWWEKPAQLMWEAQLGKLLLCRDSLHAGHCPWNKTACPYKSLSERSYFHHDFPALQAPLQTTHAC